MNPKATNTSINIEQKSKSNMPSFGPTFHELQFLHAPRNCISLKFCSQIHVCSHSQYTIWQYIDLIQSLRFLHNYFFVQYKQYIHLTIDWICVDQACFYGAWNLWSFVLIGIPVHSSNMTTMIPVTFMVREDL